MTALHRRLLRLESQGGRHAFRSLSDDELDRRLRAELGDWLRAEPEACSPAVRAEIAAALAASGAASATPNTKEGEAA